MVAFAAIAGYNVYSNNKSESFSDLLLANVEALADDEMNVEDLVANCTWEESSYCYYIVVMPSGNTVWQHSNMRNY